MLLRKRPRNGTYKAEAGGKGEIEMKRLLRFMVGGALLASTFCFFAIANLYAQRRPATEKGPSVAWKPPVEVNPKDYVGAQTCAGCHQEIAKQFFKTVHAQESEGTHAAPAAAAAPASPSAAAGKKLYDNMMCAGCHKIGGQGGTVGPALDNVGAQSSRAQIENILLKPPSGSVMPALPANTPSKKTNELVDYMMSLKGQTQAAAAAAPSGPVTVSGCEMCHGPGHAHVQAEMAAGGDPAKIAAGKKLIFHFNGSPKENSARCLSCHDSGKAQSSFAHSVHATAGVSCIDCHTMHPTDLADAGKPKLQGAQAQFFGVPRLTKQNTWLTGPMLKEPQPQLCYGCHRTVQAQFALPEHHRVGEGFMKCTDCHNPHGTMNHFQLKKANWEACVSCHVEKRGPFVYEHAVVRVDGCTACHNPHGSVNNFMLKRREQRLLCLQCHTVVHTSPEVSGWHGQANVPHGRGGFQASGPCTRCHVAIHGSNFDSTLLR